MPGSFDGTQLVAVVHTISVVPKLHDKRLRAASTNGSHGKEKIQAKFPNEETFRTELGKTNKSGCFFGGFNPQIKNEDLSPFFFVLDLGPWVVVWLNFVC